jgi:sn-glycerol 3-phosphate transport system permease protein
MTNSIPILVPALAALIGAVALQFTYGRRHYGSLIGAVVGAGAGAAGALLFMLPLQFCTFEPERAPVDLLFGLLLIGVGMGITLSIANWVLTRLTTHQPVFAVQTQPGAFKGHLLPWLFLAPTLAILLAFLYYPVFDTFGLSVLLARLGARRTAFVCVDNFTSLVSDPAYGQTVLVTLFMSLAIVLGGLVLSLGVAMMAYQPLRGARIYRTLLIWPYAISPAVAGVIFLLLLNPTGGIINHFLDNLFGLKVGWTTDPTAARWAVILASIWKSMGFNILFYIAGLQNVPNDLKEAAAIDGANAWQRFRNVTLPLLSPITFFLVVTNLTYAFFETFGTIDYLTQGGPLNSTTTMMYRIYEIGFTNNDLGKAAAQSIVLFALVIGITLLQFRTQGRQVNYGA